MEPHEYEPTPQDLIAMENAALIIVNGAGFAGWEEDVIQNMPPSKVVVASEGLATLMGEAHEEHEEEGEHEGKEEEEHKEEVIDPHVWLSPVLAQRMAERIRDGFIAADPGNEAAYRANASALVAELHSLDNAFRTGLAECARREIIASHAAFGYIAAAYDLEQEEISGLSTEEEPSPQQLVEVVRFAREHNITHIFFETLVTPELSETIAREVGAKTLVLNPLEGLTSEEIAAGKNYITEMQQNLANLRVALQCS
jgi:zinc transport system substrate-binding protein